MGPCRIRSGVLPGAFAEFAEQHETTSVRREADGGGQQKRTDVLANCDGCELSMRKVKEQCRKTQQETPSSKPRAVIFVALRGLVCSELRRT